MIRRACFGLAVVVCAGMTVGLFAIGRAARADEKRPNLLAFEDAEREPDAERRRQSLTFVVIGGGPTGVEMAGALAEIARHTLAREFRRRGTPDKIRAILARL